MILFGPAFMYLRFFFAYILLTTNASL